MSRGNIDHLWNGWRNEYVTTGGASGGVGLPEVAGSVFTRILQSGLADEDTYIVHRGRHTFVILNAFPYSTGHLMVLPYREVGELDMLDADETTELWATVTAAVRVVRHAYQPAGINVGINMGIVAGGSVSEHLHVHVVPRWLGDANFMTTVANARTIPESLAASRAKLHRAWVEVEGGAA